MPDFTVGNDSFSLCLCHPWILDGADGDLLFDDDNDDYVDDDHDADDGGRSTFNWGVWQPSYDRF